MVNVSIFSTRNFLIITSQISRLIRNLDKLKKRGGWLWLYLPLQKIRGTENTWFRRLWRLNSTLGTSIFTMQQDKFVEMRFINIVYHPRALLPRSFSCLEFYFVLNAKFIIQIWIFFSMEPVFFHHTNTVQSIF